MIVTISLIVGALGLLFYGLKRILFGDPNYWKDRGVPLVNTPNIAKLAFSKNVQFVDYDRESYNGIKGERFGGYMELWNPVLLIRDLDLMKRIFIKDFDHFANARTADFGDNDPHLTKALPNHVGDAWKELRSKLTPAFTTGKIRRMFQIFDTSCGKMMKNMEEEAARNSGEVDLKPYMTKLTMDVIASAAFGVQTDIFENPDSIFDKMAKKMQATFGGKNLFKFLFASVAPKTAQFLKLRMFDPEADSFLSKLVVDSLSHRKRTGEKREDFLQLMVEAKEGTIKVEDGWDADAHERDAKLGDVPKSSKIVFDDDMIISQSLLFLVAGSDTVEGLLTFAAYELAINADIQEKLYEELKAAADDNDGKLTYDIINGLPYLDMCISETVRKYPINVRSFRVCTKDYKIPDTNLVIPKGNFVANFTYALHHDPELWPEPQKFIPERFTKENVLKRHSMAYQPFGHGPRNCIGNRFALAETKVIIATLFLKFKLEPSSATVIPIKFLDQPLLKAADNVRMIVTARI